MLSNSLQSASVAFDQAAGLRALFKKTSVASLMLAGTLNASLKISWLFSLANWLARQQYRVLILDETRGELASALGLSVKYDLLHILEGDRKLGQVVLPVDQQIDLIPAAKGLAEVAKMSNGFQSLQHAFSKVINPPNCILVYTRNEPSSVLGSACSQQIETWLMVDGYLDYAQQLQPYLRFLQDLGKRSLGLAVSAREAYQAQTIKTQLEQLAHRFYQLQLIYRGWLHCNPNMPGRSVWHPVS